MGLTWPAGRRHARQLSRPEPSRGWALVLTSAAFFMVALDALVVITALPAIHHDLGGSVSTLEWTVNAYTLSFAAGIITAAAIGDRLRTGQFIICGSLTAPMLLDANDTGVDFALEPIGGISVRFGD